MTTQTNGYHDSVTFTVPAGQGAAVPVVVTSGGQVSNVLTFAYSRPTLSPTNGLTPTSSETDGRDAVTLERTVATLNGTNFGLEVSRTSNVEHTEDTRRTHVEHTGGAIQ